MPYFNFYLIVESLIEAVPQVHILICLFLIDTPLIYHRQTMLFSLTFASSAISAILGIAKFLKVGPCRIVPNEGILGGFGQAGFMLLYINIGSTILSKGFVVSAIGLRSKFKTSAICTWIGLNYLPNLLYVSSLII